jgi:vitamin B12 transporter
MTFKYKNRKPPPLLSSSSAIAFTIAALQWPGLAHAQSLELKLDSVLKNILVTATRMPLEEDATLAQTTVITRRDIEAAGSSSLIELLQRKAGVEIRSTGGAGQPSGVLIRGASPQQTLVLVDGLRLSSATSGGAAFENIALDLIERIEIVKGPMSSLYGSDAVGGVVQIFTRGYAKPRLTAELGLGSNSTLAFNTGFSAVEGKTSLTINAGYREVAARSASNANASTFTYNPDRDPYDNKHILLKAAHTLWQGEVLSASAWQSQGRTKFDDGPTGNPSNKQTLSGIQLGSENNFASFWKSNLKFGQTIDDIDIRSSFPGQFKTTQNQLVWQNQFATPVGAWLLGYEWLGQRVSGSVEYDKGKRTTQSFFASVNESIDQQRLSASVRRDREDQFGSRTVGSISYGIQLWSDELVYVNYGEAFRAPSFNDLYYPGFSNPLLRPEKSKSIEYGLRVTKPEYRMNLSVFSNKISDLIAFDFATNTPQNIRRARIDGVEFATDFAWGGFNWRGAVTVQRPEDVETNKQLRSRAKQFGSIAVSKTWDKWDFAVDVNGNGKRFDSGDEAVSSKLPGYTLLGGSVRYRLDKMWTLELSGQNLTGRNYELARGYNTPGRNVFFNVKVAAY